MAEDEEHALPAYLFGVGRFEWTDCRSAAMLRRASGARAGDAGHEPEHHGDSPLRRIFHSAHRPHRFEWGGAGATVLGFGTGAWPYEPKRCVVITSDTSRVSLYGEEFFSGELSGLLGRLGSDGVRRVYLDGGTLIGQALRANLVGDLTISVIPILLGEGTPLAPKLGRDVPLQLVGHRAFPSGLVQLDYIVSSISTDSP